MRQSTLLRLLAAGALASVAACSEPVTPPGPPPQSIAPPPRDGTIGVTAREIPVGASVRLEGPLAVSAYLYPVAGPYVWSTKDPSIALVSPGVGLGSWVRGLTPGTTELFVSGGGVRATVPIRVLDTLPASSPVVVEDFYVVEFGEGGSWGYAPQIVLRDTVGRLETAVIGVSFDLPGAGRAPPCAMLRTITGAPDPLFRERYGDFELSLNGPAGYRVPSLQPVVAHLTLRVPGPYAKKLTIEGRVVAGASPTTYSSGFTNDVLSCG